MLAMLGRVKRCGGQVHQAAFEGVTTVVGDDVETRLIHERLALLDTTLGPLRLGFSRTYARIQSAVRLAVSAATAIAAGTGRRTKLFWLAFGLESEEPAAGDRVATGFSEVTWLQ